ncbi:MAG: hypothetical protein ACE5GJ_06585 [Gemmatimonadota bacterium]
MQVMPVDLIALVGTIMGISIVLIPVLGITARFALKPTVEALGKLFEHRGMDETMQILERRMTLMEQQLESMERAVTSLSAAAEFHAALQAGQAPDDPEIPAPHPQTPGS